ncbi:MAG: carboxypeptidase-like regulatory domain-containing protein [Bacteroidota bacterium]
MLRAISMLLFITIISFLHASAQDTTGTVSGCVADSSGKALVGANVVVLGTMPLRGGLVKADGSYLVVGIKAGRYQIAIRAAGFKEQYKGATIGVDAETKLSAELEVKEQEDIEIGRRHHCCLYTRGRSGTEHHITPKEEGWLPYMW